MSVSFEIDRADVSARVCTLPSRFTLELGGELNGAQLGYEIAGPVDDSSAPLVCVLGGISSGRRVVDRRNEEESIGAGTKRARGWWSALAGDGRVFDTRRVRVLGVDFLGGVGLSSGPRSSGLGYRFPALTPRDQARALAHLLADLRERRFDLVVGASFGGMVGLALAEERPDLLGELVALCAAHEPDPLASAWRALQREALALGEAAGDPTAGVRLARKLAFTTYRGRLDWRERGALAAEWLDARASEFAARFDADSVRVLSSAIDATCVDPKRVTCPTTLIGFDSDLLVPIEQLRELASRLRGPVELHELASRYGHDGFLKEPRAIERILRPIVERLSEHRARSFEAAGLERADLDEHVDSAEFEHSHFREHVDSAQIDRRVSTRAVDSAEIAGGAGGARLDSAQIQPRVRADAEVLS